MDAEKRKAESGREHQKKAMAYIAAEKKVINNDICFLGWVFSSNIVENELDHKVVVKDIRFQR